MLWIWGKKRALFFGVLCFQTASAEMCTKRQPTKRSLSLSFFVKNIFLCDNIGKSRKSMMGGEVT